MSSSEEEEVVEGSAQSGGTPIQLKNLKKGDYAMICGFPCKVVEYSTAKPGKHGSAKASVVGIEVSDVQELISSQTRSMSSKHLLQPTFRCLSS